MFDTILSAEDVLNLKPHPEPILRALELLNISSAEAIMVGDTESDMEAAKAADVKTVAALYGFAGEQLRTLEPDYVIQNIAELLAILELVNPTNGKTP
jgi:pyrophosphatase PpaX